MKKLKNLFVALAICAPLTAAAQDITINEENFPDENFRNYLLGQHYGEDGVLTQEEIKGIYMITIERKNISSLKGIEHFTALYSLDCPDNQLTALDVSHNTALTRLDCPNNQLMALDVSNNTALTTLSCSGNQLTALDVSNNTVLGSLDCRGNQLTTLDVSNNTILRTLDFYDNQLTALDVSNNTVLRSLTCAKNQLTALDVSHNTALESLTCSDNQLTSLDVSNNTKLEILSCSDNQLAALDVSNNTKLTELWCDNNKIKGESMDALVTSLSKTEAGNLYVYNESVSNEGNIITKSQVAAAQAKGWTSYYFDSLQLWWLKYDGMDDTASIALPEIESSTATIYTLHGQKVTTPKKGGIYIVNGKKVVVR